MGIFVLMISILMPVYNRVEHLEAALKMYQDMYYGKVDFEMCVFDDGSSEEQRASKVIENDYYKYPIKFEEIPPKGYWRPPGIALNHLAYKMATGDIIVITCPEAKHEDRVLDNAVSYYKERDNGRTWLCAATFREELGNYQCCPDSGNSAPIYYFGAMRRREFYEVGGVDELQKHGGEDGLFVNKLYHNGFKLYWLGKIIHQKHGK